MMKRSKFMEAQLMGVPCEREAGLARAEVCRRRGASETAQTLTPQL